MDVEELTAALTRHEPDPDTVLASFSAKRRARRGVVRGRIIAAASAVLVVAAVVGLVGFLRHGGEDTAADGCGYDPLSTVFSQAREGGASVIVAKGTLTGRTTAAPTEATYDQMALTSVRTLGGPTVRSGTLGWVDARRGPSAPISGRDAGDLWGTDGSLFAIVWPSTGNPAKKGPTLRIAPVVNGSVVFGAVNGCWDTTGLPTRPFHGPLASIPGSDAYARGVKEGLQAVPLTTVEQLAAAAFR